MGSGAKEPSYNIEQDENLAMIAQTWEVLGNSSMADQVLAQIGHPTVYANVSSNLNTLRTQKIQQQMQFAAKIVWRMTSIGGCSCQQHGL